MTQLKSKSASIALLIAFVCLALVNVSALVAADGATIGDSDTDIEPVPVNYKMKHVANGVYHCTTSGSYGCDTPSSHAWYPRRN